jgi:hypothetical protein
MSLSKRLYKRIECSYYKPVANIYWLQTYRFDLFNQQHVAHFTYPTFCYQEFNFNTIHVSLQISMFSLLMRTSTPNNRLAPDKQHGRSFY